MNITQSSLDEENKTHQCENHPELKASHEIWNRSTGTKWYCCYCNVLVLESPPSDWHPRCILSKSLSELMRKEKEKK